MAESGIYPAIDVEASASRVMHNVVSPQHQEQARRFRQLYSRYQKSRDLIQLGAYVPGSDPDTDRAIQRFPALQRFITQDMREQAPFDESVRQLGEAIGEATPDGARRANAHAGAQA
jgi:flagellum-specific ATP synthase